MVKQEYQEIPKEDYMWMPAGDDNCGLCQGSGDLQCCAGEHYYTRDCYCVLIKYWEDKGNFFMANAQKKFLERTLYYRNL